MEVPDELLRAFSQRDLIVIVGPEVGTDQPDARALAEQLIELAAQDDPSLDLDDLRRRITTGQVADVLQVAHRCLGDRFGRETQERLADPGGPLPPLLTALARLRPRLRAIYTTRLDRLIERAYEGRWPSFDSPRSDLVQRRNMVFKVLGSLENPGTWVLTRAQVQRELSPDAERHEIFAAAYRAHQMLFVGFSPDSPELGHLLDMAPATEEGHGPGHYIALARCSRTDRELLEGQGLQVVDGAPVAVLEALAETLKGRTLIEPTRAPAGLEAVPDPSGAEPRSPLRRWLPIAAGLVALAVVVALMLPGDDSEPARTTATVSAPAEDLPPAVAPASDLPSTSVTGETGSTSGASDSSSEAASTTTAVDEGTGTTAVSTPPSTARPQRCHCPVGDLSACVTKRQAAAKGLRCDPDPRSTGKRGCRPTYFCR